MTSGGRLFSENEVRALLNREEGQFLEFKSLWNQETEPLRPLGRRQVRDIIAEYVAAFANADGGLLLLGVEDDGRATGHTYPEEAIVEFMAVPDRRLRPQIRCRLDRIRIEGREILVFDVPNAPEAVMVEGNGFPYRVGDQVVREPQEVINRRKEAYRRVGYEQRVRLEATLDDLDLDLAKRFVRGTVVGDRPVEEVLHRYGLLQPRAEGWGLTNAALLLFGRLPLTRWHPRAGIRFFRVAGTERHHGTKRNVTQLGRVDLPLASAILEAHRLAREQIRRSEKLHDLFFKETPEYPEFAWQEAVVNAFAHRDYEVQGQEIEVWFFDDRMEVRSPGELIPPVTLELASSIVSLSGSSRSESCWRIRKDSPTRIIGGSTPWIATRRIGRSRRWSRSESLRRPGPGGAGRFTVSPRISGKHERSSRTASRLSGTSSLAILTCRTRTTATSSARPALSPSGSSAHSWRRGFW